MAWTDNIRRGSFRDAEFIVSDTENEIGRRVAIHEYPFREDSYPEDTGGLTELPAIECYVAGPDYMAHRDALIAALKKPGPGLLIHPLHGRITVQALNSKYREGTREQGVARFSIRFVIAGKNDNPRASINTAGVLGQRASSSFTAVSNNFGSQFSVLGWPQFVSDAAESVLSSGLDRIDSFSSFTGLATSGVIDTAELVRNPMSIVDTVLTRVKAIGAISDLRRLVTFGQSFSNVSPSTPSRVVRNQNQTYLLDLFNNVATIEMAERVATDQVTLDNTQDAISYRDEVAENIDVISATASDPVFESVQSLRVALVQDINQRLAQLPAVVEYVPPETTPALVLAHQLYGNATRESEIITRNKISHGGFVPGGQPVEYLK